MQAARDKDGVFLPKEIYEQQMKTKESADQEIKEKTLQIKALEEEMEKLNVSYFKSTLKSAFQTVELNKWQFCHNIEISPKWPILIFSTLT